MRPVQSLLVVGMADRPYMTELLRALDEQLPCSSSLTLFSQYATETEIGRPAHAASHTWPCLRSAAVLTRMLLLLALW